MLIFNTAPVAFGALGVPVTVLGAVTGLPAATLGAMIGRQLPFMALILPFYVMALYGGMRSVRALWPVLLVAGGSFATAPVRRLQLHRLFADRRARVARLADRHAAASCRSGSPRPIPNSRSRSAAMRAKAPSTIAGLAGLAALDHRLGGRHRLDLVQGLRDRPDQRSPGRGCDKAISITLYDNKPYAAIWMFQPLATGTAILVAAI